MYYVRSDLRPSLCREKMKNNLDKQFIPAHEACYRPWISQLRAFAFALPFAWHIPLLYMAWSHSRKYPKEVSHLAVRSSLASLLTVSNSRNFTISFLPKFFPLLVLILLTILFIFSPFLPSSLPLSLPQYNTGSTGIRIFLWFFSVLLTGPPGARSSLWHREGGQIFAERRNTFLAVFLQWLMTLFSQINTENSFWFLQLGARFSTS